MTETPDTTKTQSAVDTLFEATQKNYSILESLKVGLLSNLFTGFHGRTGPKRIAKMRKAKPAKALTSELAALSAIEANHFLALATANKEQAEAAFRYTAIVNFTAPITFIVLLNQILPGGVIEVVSAYLDLDTFGLTAVILLFILAVIYPIAHAYLGTSNARDIYHLSMIEVARRGGSFTSDAGSGEDLSSNPADS